MTELAQRAEIERLAEAPPNAAALIEQGRRAGIEEAALVVYGFGDGACDDCCLDTLGEAAIAIRALLTSERDALADSDVLTEREAQAKLDGVRAGIEASAGMADSERYLQSYVDAAHRDGDTGPQVYNGASDNILAAIRALDAAAIAKGEG